MRFRICALLLVALVAVAGCSQEFDNATDPAASLEDNAGGVALTELGCAGEPTLINGYNVELLSRTFDGTHTTFLYRVYGTGQEPALSHFRIELPDCAPELSAYSPTNSVNINNDPQHNVYGIEWHLSVEPDDSEGRQYSITFPGDIPLGVVQSVVKTTPTSSLGVIPGPCAGFVISGTVFADADSSTTRDAAENGIPNVTVALTDAGGCVEKATSDANGFFSFIRAAGTYTLSLSLTTPESDFNDNLSASFDPSTNLSRQVTVGPDATGEDFGFAPRPKKITNDIETGVLFTDGQTIRFWQQQIRTALKNGGKTPVYDKATLLEFIEEIQALALPDPFVFTPGSELLEAFDILSDKSKDALAVLRRALLATEFNHVAGLGLVGERDLQLVLIGYGESVLVDPPSRSGASGGDGERLRDPTGVGDTADMFNAINSDDIVYGGTGGGGGDE